MSGDGIFHEDRGGVRFGGDGGFVILVRGCYSVLKVGMVICVI